MFETFEKCSILAKVKEGEDFNHSNSAYSGIEYFESRHERDEPDAEIGQISTDFERGRFAKVSVYELNLYHK